jgi:hypothetical protein
MAGKIGEDFVKDMIDRGRRELGGVLYHDSNVAQPMYPLHGRYRAPKEIDSQEIGERESDELQPVIDDRDDPDIER